MPLFSPNHRSQDGIVYAYFWVRILAEADLSTAIILGNQTDQTETTVMIEGLEPAREQMTCRRAELGAKETARIVGVSHYTFADTYDASRHGVSVRELPAGTKCDAAKAWIGSEEGRRWAGRGFCFLAHSAVFVEA